MYTTLVAITYFGAKISLNNPKKLSPGMLVFFLFLLLSVIANVVMLALNLGPIFQVYAASDRIKELIDVPNTQKGTVMQQDPQGNLEIRNVKFSYPGAEEIQVLNDVSIEVSQDKHKVVALVGSSGCGKSSIIALIEDFYRPSSGQVLFNGIDIKSLDPQWYH